MRYNTTYLNETLRLFKLLLHFLDLFVLSALLY